MSGPHALFRVYHRIARYLIGCSRDIEIHELIEIHGHLPVLVVLPMHNYRDIFRSFGIPSALYHGLLDVEMFDALAFNMDTRQADDIR